MADRLWKTLPPVDPRGRPKIYDDAVKLWDKCVEYFKWCDEHPIEKNELIKFQGTATVGSVPVDRPYTMDGICVYLGVSNRYFDTAERQLIEKRAKLKTTPADNALIEVYARVRAAIRDQQLSGAVVGVFDANIVARINALVDRKDVTSGGAPVLKVEVADQQTADAMDALTRIDDNPDDKIAEYLDPNSPNSLL